MVNAQLVRYCYSVLMTASPNVILMKRLIPAHDIAQEEDLGIWI